MKRKIIKLFLLFLLCNAYGISNKTLVNTQLFETDGLFNYYACEINKNEIVRILKPNIYYGVSNWKYSVKVLYRNKEYLINIENLMPENTQFYLDNNISLLYSDDIRWLPVYCFDSLQEKNRDVIIKKQPKGFQKYQKEKTEFDDEWDDSLSNIVPTYFFNSVFNISNLFNRSSFLIKNIKKAEATYVIEAEVYDWFMPDSMLNYSKGDSVLLTISIDGDYLNFFCNNQQLGQFVKTNSKTKNEIESLIANNTCNFSNITWPRHADGTCDYETTVRLQSGKRYRASDNLRLRSSGSTAGKPVITIGKGTQVKVLGIGAEQTIDGITSNWVQVEVQAGAKDRDGKAIAAGTVGWCFGGYLAER